MAKPVACGSAAPGEASSGKPKRVLPSPGKAPKQPTRKGPAGGTGGIVIDGGVTRHDVPPRGQQHSGLGALHIQEHHLDTLKEIEEVRTALGGQILGVSLASEAKGGVFTWIPSGSPERCR